ncbi:MAG TPA: PQQ-binding-like beta-propeller repeat protein [Fimbriimonas sp.]
MSLTRRELLAGTAAFAVSRYVRPTSESFRFVFFSDTHVGLKLNIEQNRAMLAEMLPLGPDFAVNGGDVTDYGWRGEYDNYRSLLKDVPFNVRHIAGNHDVRWSPLGPKAFKEGTGDPMYGSFDHKGCRFILLDSTVPLSHYGHFESEQLRWLEADLKRTGRETPVFVFTHHWVGRDRVMADNEAALLKVIEPYNVKLVFNGHGHSDLLWTWNDIANTMNKGLYQGSYQLVEVDDREVRLSRRTAERPERALLTTVALKPDSSKRQVWSFSFAAGNGVVLRTRADADEARWGDGKWQKIENGLVPMEGLIPGHAALALRRGTDRYRYAGEVRIGGSGGVMRKAWETQLSGGVMSHLRESRNVLFVSAMDGSLTALQAQDGKPLWTARTGGYCHSSPTVHNDLVIVGSADGNVYAFDRYDGARAWRVATGGPVYASAAVAQGVVVIGSGDGSVYGIDPIEGRQVWRFDLPRSNTAFVQSPAATDGDRVFLGAWDKFLYCLDPQTGRQRWKQDCVGERSFAYSPAIGGPCVGVGRVFVPANGNLLWSFDAETGRKLWSASSPGDKFGYSSPTYSDGRIVVGCLGDKGEVRCLDSEDGSILWTAETGSVIYDSGPAVTDGLAFIGSVSGILTAVDMADGRIRGQYALPTGHFLSSPATTPGRVYAATYSDRCFAFDLLL